MHAVLREQPAGEADGAAGRDAVVPGDDQLQVVQDAYDQGMMLRAFAAASAIGPLQTWRGPAGRVLGGRLAHNLGANHLGRVLSRLGWRESPDDPAAIYYNARAIFERRGPLPAWEFMRRQGELSGAAPARRADWLSFHAQIAGQFRDFQAAEQWLARAEAADSSHAWVHIERADLLQRQDRYVEALAAARASMEMRPWYRPGVQHAAELLQLLDRDEEALQLLSEAVTCIQSGPVLSQLAILQTELKRYDAARDTWDRVPSLLPLADKTHLQWLAARRSDAAYYCGDYEQAAALAQGAKNAFHDKIAQRVLERKDAPRALLAVGFVRQHHMTCAPATLSALSGFWGMPADHLALVEKVCYDGTPSHSERNWAERNGFVAREFTVTGSSATALIDRGIPFTLATVETDNAHLQAVIGYDDRRQTLIIRDPYERVSAEFLTDGLCERYAAFGPRGMAMVPVDRAGALDGVELPDASLYDALYVVQSALVAHDRDLARQACEQMQASAPQHRLTLWARRSLAWYDSDTASALTITRSLLEQFPRNGNLRLFELHCMRVLESRDQRLEFLKGLCGEKACDPIFWEQYARELNDDARESERCIHLIRRALRYRRHRPDSYHALAGLLWDQRQFDEAEQLYRIAACLGDKDEGMARSWFIASRHLKRTDACLAQMRDRVRRFGRRSGQPARTLSWACAELGQVEQGLEVLEQALRERPDDADLMLFAAGSYSRHGQLDRAGELLEAARGRSRETTWLRASAELAGSRGDRTVELAAWRQVGAAEPLAMDAHRNLARLLEETEGRDTALQYLRKAVERFPFNYPLNQLEIEWLRESSAEEHAQAARRLIALHPADAWSRRELAGALIRMGQLDEAEEEAQTVIRLDPNNASSHFYLGRVLEGQRRLPDARAAFKRAIELSVDSGFAISRLVDTCENLDERKEALAFVLGELKRQTTFGEGLLAYRTSAAGTLEAEDLLASLQEALGARPDLWHAWSALTRQLRDMHRLDEAMEAARFATTRFPLLPRLWVDLAEVCQSRRDHPGAIAAYAKAHELSPGWSTAARGLAEGYSQSGDGPRAVALLEQFLLRAPLDAVAQGDLAVEYWRLDRRAEAMARMAQALRLEPGMDWAWNTFRSWSKQLDGNQEPAQLARELTISRPGEARSWLILGETLGQSEELEERLSALKRATELNPQLVAAYDLRAELLADDKRYDEALLACAPDAWGDAPPVPLRGRRAWIESQRGNLPLAMQIMEEAVADDPHYYWGWCRLADWSRSTNDNERYLKAGRQIHQRWPRAIVGFGYLGEALVRSKFIGDAQPLLREAIELEPDYTFAAQLLLDIGIDADHWDDCDRALQLLEKHDPGNATLMRRAKVLAARRQRPEAIAALTQLWLAKEPARQWMVDSIRDLLKKRHLVGVYPESLRAAIADASAPPLAGELLIRELAEQKAWKQAEQFVRSELAWLAKRKAEGTGKTPAPAEEPRLPLARAIASAWLDVLGNAALAKPLNRFLKRHRSWVHGDRELWEKATYPLKATRQYQRVLRWVGDYAARGQVAGWVLINIGQSHRALGDDAKSRAVHRSALGLEMIPRHRTVHRLWLAFDAARDGDISSVEQLLSECDMNSIGGLQQLLAGLVEAVKIMNTPSDEPQRARRKLANEAMRVGAGHFPKFRFELEYRRAYLQAARAVSLLRYLDAAWSTRKRRRRWWSVGTPI